MNRYVLQITIFIILIGISYQHYLPADLMNPNALTQQAPIDIQPVQTKRSELIQEIKEKGKALEESPQNAKIDKVWKKMPGRNGLKLNVDQSYENMKEQGTYDESLLVFDQVEPDVKLKDLPPSPIYRGHPEKDMVSFLINVAWGEDNIPSILNTLKKHNVRATFFIEGKWASNNMDLVKMIKEEGHLIGNHAYNHPDMNRLSDEENRLQIKKTNDIIRAITSETPKWFAPPSGSFNERVVSIASELEMQTILWSVDTIDWKKPTTSVMVNRVMSNIHSGAMILMHPTDVIKNGLEELILNIKQKEYKIGAIDRLLSEKR
ncbi:polysaccharide deacetylase family protein [Aquibacillus albus]|uniref:Sporulation protein (Polysaccharide deacetylase family) n=1 Tax=Aquibacillus albus TaxID=1168171 RepID=A0ABS2N1W6_9BACI|nr:polysaccharide deacetylase family protein [Aquibacillus albus]MBM7572073.1 putative sporulation protein (polysaccharide deacetylase family) [Aquibacillus albus]